MRFGRRPTDGPKGLRVRARLALLLALVSSGCAHVKPWERGKLAHFTMVDDVGGPAEEHVHAVQEGAAGGGAGAASGCGCN
jgi:hypothetical protein